MATMIKVEKSLSPVRSKTYVTNKQEMQYKIFGDVINVKKYIAIVLDCSEAMGYYKLDGARNRFEVMKENAIRIIEKFKNSPETQVCIFAYTDMAKEVSEFVRIDGDSNIANREKLVKLINGLVSENNSNLGDGMRKAYWKLKKLPNDGLKSMVIMSGGEPNMFTTVSEHLYHDFETLQGNIDFITNDNASNYVYADYSSAVRYCQEVAKFINVEKINTFVLGFNKNESYKLEAISSACGVRENLDGKHYLRIEGLKDLDKACGHILNEIECKYPLEVSFKENMPAGVKVLSVPEGFTLNLKPDGTYEIDGKVQGMILDKIDEFGGFRVNPWTCTIGLQYCSDGKKEFNALEVLSKDRYGNPLVAEMVNKCEVDILIDTIPPVTTCTLNGISKDNNWYSSDIEVMLTATDGVEGTEVEKIQYKLGKSEWQIYKEPFIVRNEGITTLDYRAVDNAGNIEADRTIDLKIDKTAPVVKCSLNGTKGELNNWFVSDVEVVLSAEDEPIGNNSGVEKIQYKFENGIWQDYNMPISVLDEGMTSLYYRSIDKVGNVSIEKNTVVQIDKSGPIITAPTNLTYIASGNSVALSNIGNATAKDELSGVKTITNDSIKEFQVGSTVVTWKAIDGNGNVSTSIENITIENPKLPGQYQYDIIRTGQASYKVWFVANGFIPSSLRVKVRTNGYDETTYEMALNDGVWECKLNNLPMNSVIRYVFVYTKNGANYKTDESYYKVTAYNAIDSDYTKGIKNISLSEAKIWFRTNQFTSNNVKFCYAVDNVCYDCVHMFNNNNVWEFSYGNLSNGCAIKYYFIYNKGTDVEYRTPEYSYVHYRE